MTSEAAKDIISLPQRLIKRDGVEVSFDRNRIEKALEKAGQATTEFDSFEAQLLTRQVIKVLSHRYSNRQVPDIEAGLFVGLSCSHNRIICNHFDSKACTSDATLSIDTLNAINLIQQEVDPDTLFFQRKLKINGDTELAHHVKNTIDTLDPEVIPAFMLTIMDKYKMRVLLLNASL